MLSSQLYINFFLNIISRDKTVLCHGTNYTHTDGQYKWELTTETMKS